MSGIAGIFNSSQNFVLETIFVFLRGIILKGGLIVMTNQSDVNQLEKVALRIREMRQIMGYTSAQMAELTEISEKETWK